MIKSSINPSPIINKKINSKRVDLKKYMTITNKNSNIKNLKKLENFEILGSNVIDATSINIHRQSSNSSEIEKQNSQYVIGLKTTINRRNARRLLRLARNCNHHSAEPCR
jgi:hypothetical protein